MTEKLSRGELLKKENFFDYKNPKQPIDIRVANLLNCMTIEETCQIE